MFREVCDIAQRSMKETKLKAVCNICVLVAVTGILVIATGKGWADITCGCVLSELGAFGGILFGDMLERVQKERWRDTGTVGGTGETGEYIDGRSKGANIRTKSRHSGK